MDWNINPDLIGDSIMDNVVNGVREAQKQAIREGIKANAVLINDRFVKIKEWLYTARMTFNGEEWGGPCIGFPPMIGGLAAFFTDEIPEELAFLVGRMPGGVETYESMKKENERLRAENEKLQKLADFVQGLFKEEDEPWQEIES